MVSKNHDKTYDLWICFMFLTQGRRLLPINNHFDEALSFGWIDGIRKHIDEDNYSTPFPRQKKRSIWSNVNTKIINELIKGEVQPMVCPLLKNVLGRRLEFIHSNRSHINYTIRKKF